MKLIEAITLAIVAVVFGPFLIVVTLLGPLSKLIGAFLDLLGK